MDAMDATVEIIKKQDKDAKYTESIIIGDLDDYIKNQYQYIFKYTLTYCDFLSLLKSKNDYRKFLNKYRRGEFDKIKINILEQLNALYSNRIKCLDNIEYYSKKHNIPIKSYILDIYLNQLQSATKLNIETFIDILIDTHILNNFEL